MRAPTMADFPPHFFKYRSLNGEEERERVRRTILHHEIYWAAPRSFNDPFDCAPIFLAPPQNRMREVARRAIRYELPRDAPRWERKRRMRQLARITPSKMQANLDRLMPEAMDETAVYSVASHGDDILMWSHYAGSHSGVTLRFRVRPLLDAFAIAYPVHYSTERPRVMVGIDDQSDMLQKILLTKADFWAYEREFRFVGWRERAGIRQIPETALDGIILGARITDSDAELVQNWVRERVRPIAVLRASLDPRFFRIDVGS